MISKTEISISDNCFHDEDHRGQKVLNFYKNGYIRKLNFLLL